MAGRARGTSCSAHLRTLPVRCSPSIHLCPSCPRPAFFLYTRLGRRLTPLAVAHSPFFLGTLAIAALQGNKVEGRTGGRAAGRADKGRDSERKGTAGCSAARSCSSLRLINIEARVSEVGLADEAKGWAERLMEAAYTNVKPYRKLKVLINPVGGPGKALPLFQSRIRPVLEAAGCIMNVTVTTHVNHGLEIAQTLPLEEGYDAIVCVSGDGMLHEVLNGLAQRADAREALQTPVAPIPTGSGNAVALNLLGVAEGFNLALACLNLIKGQVMPLDVCSITQPADALDAPTERLPKRQAGARNGRASQGVASPVSLNSAPTAPYTIHYSFLSQAIGLMADVDLGTEDMRALGDTRFVLGYIGGVLSNKECEVDIFVKMGHRGTRNKQEMRERMKRPREVLT
ncbi:hypothetical protein L7F22_047101 [Adiantum nelumboides]|nr:hypothetical protein [Adiantum nelumboides]